MHVASHISLSGFAVTVRCWQQAFHFVHSRPLIARRRWRPDQTFRYTNTPAHMEATSLLKRQRVEATAQDAAPAQDAAQQTASVATASSVIQSDSQTRKTKTLPTPVLVPPGQLTSRPDLWDCAALLVDKPQTWTSFDVCGKLKGVLSVKKIGHAGTLDPMATGLLIICTGKGTKSIDTFQAMHKEYSGTIKLGEATTSYDADGDINQTLPWEQLTLEQLREEVHKSFLGNLQQMPPMFSAIRVKGRRLYESAREGKVVERAARSVNVSQFDLTADAEDKQRVHFYISCSKGTYIRSLAHDLGQAVGSAAHLVALRREAIGKYNVKDAWTVQQLTEQMQQQKQCQQAQQENQQQHGASNGDAIGKREAPQHTQSPLHSPQQ